MTLGTGWHINCTIKKWHYDSRISPLASSLKARVAGVGLGWSNLEMAASLLLGQVLWQVHRRPKAKVLYIVAPHCLSYTHLHSESQYNP